MWYITVRMKIISVQNKVKVCCQRCVTFIAGKTFIIYKLIIILICGRICKYLNSFTLCMQVQCQCKEISVRYIDPILFISVRNKILCLLDLTVFFSICDLLYPWFSILQV